METALSAKQYARIRRKVRVKKLNEPPRLTVGEEVFNASSHGFGTGLAVAGLVLLLQRSDTPLRLTASCFYGVSMVVMMLMSSVYHAMPSVPVHRNIKAIPLPAPPPTMHRNTSAAPLFVLINGSNT